MPIFGRDLQKKRQRGRGIQEAEKLGFGAALVPPGTKGVGKLKSLAVPSVAALVDRIRGKA